MDMEASFGRWLRARRRALDLTQDDLARRAGCSVVTIRKIEADERRPSRQIAERLADGLMVATDQRAAIITLARAEPYLDPTPAEAPEHPPRAPQRPPTNLPTPLTRLIGRKQDIAAVRNALMRGEVRLLTLIGPAGIGKTRLSIEVARDVYDAFGDGAYFVALAPIGDPTLVIATIAQTLGLKETVGQPLLEQLKAVLQARRLLLVLDNFEHLLDAAPIVVELLEACPGLKTLMTSRAALHVGGERLYPVPPLLLPDLAQRPARAALARNPAVALFVERAQAINPDFTLTAENAPAVAAICVQLDGLPLAIELATTRIKLLPPEALLARLVQRLALLTDGARDRPPRHQTLRAAIAWSYDLLDAGEQTLFARLGVFVGGCTLAAAEGVCNASGDLPLDALEGLATLVDTSLLRREEGGDGEPRFTMLETIREYALELLVAHGDAHVLRRRHAAYFLALAEAAETQQFDVNWAARMARLEAEHDNLRAALGWSQATAGDASIGLRLAKELLYLWMGGGHWTEAHSWLTRVLAHPQGSERALLRAQVLTSAGYMFGLLSNYAAAQAAFAESLAICEDLGDTHERAWVLNRMGMLARDLGDTTLARTRLEQSLELYREQGDNDGIIEGLNTLGQAVIQEDVAWATSLLEESLALSRLVGNANGTAWALNHLGHIAEFEHDYGRAMRLHRESLALFRVFGQQHPGIPWAHQSLGECALAQGDLVGAQAWFAAGLAQFRSLGSREGVAVCLAELGSITGLDGRPAQAARLWGAAEALRQAIGWGPAPPTDATYERAVAAVRANIGDEAFAAAWAEGLMLPLDQAIAEVLRADS